MTALHFVEARHRSAQMQLHTMFPLPALQAVYARVADGLILNNWSADLWVGQGVTLVDWFRVFAGRLQRGYYHADNLTPHSNVPTGPDSMAFRGISLYPRTPPDCVSFELPMLPVCLVGAAACCGSRQTWNPVSMWGRAPWQQVHGHTLRDQLLTRPRHRMYLPLQQPTCSLCIRQCRSLTVPD